MLCHLNDANLNNLLWLDKLIACICENYEKRERLWSSEFFVKLKNSIKYLLKKNNCIKKDLCMVDVSVGNLS